MRPRTMTLALALLLCSAALAETEFSVPPELAEWRNKIYTQRFFLKVEAPGEAGNVNLHNEMPPASVILPLRMLDATPSSPARPESMLLIGEDGLVHPILARAAPGGKEVEIAFSTRPGLRRFCLYAGVPDGKAEEASALTFSTEALRVIVRGRSIPGDLIYTPERPLTLERFRQIDERDEGGLGTRYTSNIDDRECPFLSLTVDQLGHIQRVDNPRNYAALYEGFLRVPVKGQYKFAVDTLGAAHLLIDGREVLSVETPDVARAPFSLHKTVQLAEGLHRVTLYYAEAGTTPGRTNAELSRFGVRLHWQPPSADGLMCIPPQAFPRALPAVVMRAEESGGVVRPFIHIERLGQVRVAAHLGERQAREHVLIYAKLTGAPAGAKLQAGTQQFESSACSWMPCGDVAFSASTPEGRPIATRTAAFPASREGARDVMDLEAELVVRSAPEFLYPDETGQVHLETLLSPAPMIVTKERMEHRMLPPPPRPMGQFQVISSVGSACSNARNACVAKDATPLEGTRQKLRVPVLIPDLEAQARDGTGQLTIQLCIGGAAVQDQRFRLLHSKALVWPGVLIAGAGSLLLSEKGSPDVPELENGGRRAVSHVALDQRTDLERVMLVLPREDEREYRFVAPLKAALAEKLGANALFLGDPLAEDRADANAGLPPRLAKAFPQLTWQTIAIPGPHRYLPIYRLVAAVDAFAKKQAKSSSASEGGGRGVPAFTLIVLGAGDAARQTPLHTFERALDVLVDRLRLAGVKRILVVGVVPEPTREKQAQAYQERVLDIQRQHHIEGIDLFAAWTKEKDWARRFALEGGESSPVYGAVPNDAALDEIVEEIKKAMK